MVALADVGQPGFLIGTVGIRGADARLLPGRALVWKLFIIVTIIVIIITIQYLYIYHLKAYNANLYPQSRSR